MLDLTATQAAQVQGRSLRLPLFLFFDFLSGPKRYWIGERDITLNGFVWEGKPITIGIDFGNISVNGTAENFVLRLSGVDIVFLQKVEGEFSEFRNRTIELWFQFFDDNWKPLDTMFKVRTGRMLGVEYATTPNVRTFTLKCESKFTARGFPPLSHLSNAEQLRRFPGDLMLERIAALQNAVVQWPILTS